MEHIIFKDKKLVIIDTAVASISLLLILYLLAFHGFNIYVGILFIIVVISIIRATFKLTQPKILLSKVKENLIIHGNPDIKITIKNIIKIESLSLGFGWVFNYGSIIIHTMNDTYIVKFTTNINSVRSSLKELIKND